MVVTPSLTLSPGKLSFSYLLRGDGPSVIKLNLLTAASLTARTSLMNKSLVCSFFWSVSNTRLSPISAVIHVCWGSHVLRNLLALAFSFLLVVRPDDSICSHALMQAWRFSQYSIHQLQLILGKPYIVETGELFDIPGLRRQHLHPSGSPVESHYSHQVGLPYAQL